MSASTRGGHCLRALGSTGHRHDLALRPFPSFQTARSGPPASALPVGLQSLACSTGLAREPLLSCRFHRALHLALSSAVTACLLALTVRWKEYFHSPRNSPLCAALRWPALEAQEWWRWPCTVTAEVAPHGQDCGGGKAELLGHNGESIGMFLIRLKRTGGLPGGKGQLNQDLKFEESSGKKSSLTSLS